MALVDDDTPLLNVPLCDHCTVYGVAANPLPLSVEAVHVQAGLVFVVGVVVDGVPGVDGAALSINTEPFDE